MRNVDDSWDEVEMGTDVLDEQLGITREVCERLAARLQTRQIVPPAEPQLAPGSTKIDRLWNLHRWRNLLLAASAGHFAGGGGVTESSTRPSP